MSFWSKLAKIGMMAGGALAAPVTGGASLFPVLAAAGGGAMAGGGLADGLFGGGGGGNDWLASDGGPLSARDLPGFDATMEPAGLPSRSTTANAGAMPGGAPGRASGGGGVNWSSLLKYGAPTGASAIKSLMDNRNAGKDRELQKQRMALEESTLDPFRGYMAQAKDLGRLDLMDRDQTPPATVLDAKYGAGLNLPAPQSYGPSAVTRSVLRGARDQIASGNRAPTMMDAKNYGQLPVVQGAPQASAGVPPDDAMAQLMARLAARRVATPNPRMAV